jgi:Ni/Fe-hydrogenase subunit HybB-like protein
MSVRARPLGGKLQGPFVTFLVALWAVATAALAVRIVGGLGAATAMNDGYPWGLWIAFDVVVGTGLASGGYAVALLAYVLNKGRYHPLVRPALLTSLLGYTAAGTAILFDVGRYWNLWKIPFVFWQWNGTSILLEVALCVMAYIAVLNVELAPALLERWRDGGNPRLAKLAEDALPWFEKALPWVIAAGLLLPTMHQSSLGSLLLAAPSKMHPLWLTPILPFLYVLTALGMGYAIVFFESTFTNAAFHRPLETPLLGRLGGVIAIVLFTFVLARFAGLWFQGHIALVVRPGLHTFLFWVETVLLLAAGTTFLRGRAFKDLAVQLQGSFLALAGAGMYRIDTYLVAFDPGSNWHYFPSLGEIAVTVGILAVETLVYLWAIRRFPILAGVAATEPRRAPAAVQEGVVA